MSDDLLFDIPEQKSPRLLWIEKHGFLTSHSPIMDPPWIALVPMARDKGKDIGTIMSESCRRYDDANILGYGQTEAEAIEECAVLMKIPLWNEGGPA